MTRIKRRIVLKAGTGLFLTGCGLNGSGFSRHSAFDPFVDDDAVARVGRVQRREASAVELVEIVIVRIEALDGQINEIATRTFERARERARNPAEGFFSGVPFLIKDMIDVGSRTVAGERAIGMTS